LAVILTLVLLFMAALTEYAEALPKPSASADPSPAPKADPWRPSYGGYYSGSYYQPHYPRGYGYGYNGYGSFGGYW
ncbi:hypothetical protein SK128_026856, partial [Halocaridina rubra]